MEKKIWLLSVFAINQTFPILFMQMHSKGTRFTIQGTSVSCFSPSVIFSQCVLWRNYSVNESSCGKIPSQQHDSEKCLAITVVKVHCDKQSMWIWLCLKWFVLHLLPGRKRRALWRQNGILSLMPTPSLQNIGTDLEMKAPTMFVQKHGCTAVTSGRGSHEPLEIPRGPADSHLGPLTYFWDHWLTSGTT